LGRDDLRGVAVLVLLFVAVMGGRELGNLYSTYREIQGLQVVFQVSERDLASYLLAVQGGGEASLEVGMVIASPQVNTETGLVKETPEYVRRWLVGLTVNPVSVVQPAASDVELEMLVEGVVVERGVYPFPREKLGFLTYRTRVLQLRVGDPGALRRAVEGALDTYGGEVEVTLRGRVRIHLLFLETWLPFQVSRYPLVRVPHLEYLGSRWMGYAQGEVEALGAGEGGYVLAVFRNPTRVHSLMENITCSLGPVGGRAALNVSKTVSVPPGLEGEYVFPFVFEEAGEYVYVFARGGEVLGASPRPLVVAQPPP